MTSHSVVFKIGKPFVREIIWESSLLDWSWIENFSPVYINNSLSFELILFVDFKKFTKLFIPFLIWLTDSLEVLLLSVSWLLSSELVLL